MLIVYNRGHLTIAELWKTDICPESIPKADLLRFCGSLSPIQNAASEVRAHNLVIDLTQGKSELLAQMKQDTRNQVRRAMNKDSLEVNINSNCTSADIDVFCRVYDNFAKSRGQRIAVRPRLEGFAKGSALVLSSVKQADGEIIVRHAYLLSETSATLHYSVSMFRDAADKDARTLMGRANRYLHWMDMLYFKDEGYSLYDFSGVDISGKSEQTTQITQFKTSFGGTVVPEYSATIPQSLKGRMAYSMLRTVGIDF